MAIWNGAATNFFDVMGDAQPRLLNQIPFSITLSKSKVREALPKISSVYQNLRRNNHGRIDWKDPVFRCAYVFLYFPKHSHLVLSALLQNRRHFESLWSDKNVIKVCSIGGGPGSDIAGVMAFLSRINICSALQCSVLDIFPEWESSWRAIEPHVPSRIQHTSITYHKFDLLKEPPFSDEVINILESSDLVTFVKSFSAVSTESMYSTVLTSLVKTLKPGAFVLFIDNSRNQNKNDEFKELFQRGGFKLVYETNDDPPLSLPTNTAVKEFSTLYDYKPMRQCSVTTYLLYKTYVTIPTPSPTPMQLSQVSAAPLFMSLDPPASGTQSHDTTTSTDANLLRPNLKARAMKGVMKQHKAKQKKTTKSDRTKDLIIPELKLGDVVRVQQTRLQKECEKLKAVVSKKVALRSYELITEHGLKLCRNIRHLTKTKEKMKRRYPKSGAVDIKPRRRRSRKKAPSSCQESTSTTEKASFDPVY